MSLESLQMFTLLNKFISFEMHNALNELVCVFFNLTLVRTHTSKGDLYQLLNNNRLHEQKDQSSGMFDVTNSQI